MKPYCLPPRPGALLAILTACATLAFAGPLAAQPSRPGTDARGPTDAGTTKDARGGGGEADAAAPPACVGCGTVTAIREGGRRTGPEWTATVSGGVVGGASGADSGTYPGAGGYKAKPPRQGLGTGIGPTVGARDSQAGFKRSAGYDVTVRMEDGSTRTVHTESRPALSVGDRVKVAGGQVYLR